ncbi:hybrid sensor histidine kinase/response regulator [Puteibacter caeruleilacunae]|nr:hybrid sensor histidine kinase/response regulator [Puteibacter caeruleilacunae]
MKKYLLLILVFCSSLIASASKGPMFKHITSNHGLVYNSVFSITQDSEGFMWFGTGKGLSKYDGIKIVNYIYSAKDSTGIPKGDVSQLVTDHNGDVWMRIGGEIARFNKLNDHFIVYGKRRKGKFYLAHHINHISKDQKGGIWISTNKGIYHYDDDKSLFVRYELLPDEIKSASIKAILHDHRGRLWIVLPKLLYRLDDLEKYDEYEVIKLDPLIWGNRPFGRIGTIIDDQQDNVYISVYGKGMIKIDVDDKITRFAKDSKEGRKLSSNEVLPIEVDASGRYWIGTELGINIWENDDTPMVVIEQDYNNPSGLNNNAIHALYNDRQGNMWVGTYFGGVNVHLANRKEFYHYQAGNASFNLSGKVVNEIIEDDQKGLWIATEDKGLNYFSAEDKSFTHYTDVGKKRLSYNNVHALVIGDDKSVWIGTNLGGLNHFSNGKFSSYKKGYGKYDLKSDNIFALCQGKKKNIWVGTTSGLVFFDPQREMFTPAQGDMQEAFIYDLMKDSKGNIWIGTLNNGIWFSRQGADTIVSISDVMKPSVLKPNRIFSISESSDGLIWFGTDEEGVYSYNPAERTLNQYTKEDGLPDNTIYAIVEDDNSNIWMSSNNGLVYFDRKNHSFKSYTTSDGLPVNQFNYKSGYKHSDGTLYFGTVDGMISFRTEDITVNPAPPEVRITKFLLHNEPITPDSEEKILRQSIYNTRSIVLDHDQTEIGFEFVAFDYTAPEQNKFVYQLEGYDDNWIEVGNYNKAFYSRIPPGTYTFKVKACNSDGVWNEQGVQLQLIVKPPFWNSYAGYLLYLVLFAVIALLTNRRIQIRRREKAELTQAKLEKEQNETLNKLKLEFYTQVSHELRTPLSLIVDPLHKVIAQPDSPSSDSLLKIVLKNANRLQLMVNQLLDFRKTEEHHFKLHIAKGDLSGFVENIFDRFTEEARKKTIDYTFSNQDVNGLTYYDAKVVDIILYNLLSNAIKYTDKGGEITCQLYWKTDEHKVVCIQVADNGIGMKQKDAQRVFENFYVVNASDSTNKSLGVGLALVNKLVELHRGKVTLETAENKGSSFCVELPATLDQYPGDHIDDSNSNTNTELHDDFQEINTESETGVRSYKLVLVEDHEDLRHYLKEFLEKYFYVFTADNGKDALQIIETEMPDVVVSDVMMPLMDGFELCNHIKSNIETSHIPVVLLTARSSEEDQAEGLENGADVYLSKPFNSEILKAHLINIINLKKVLRKRFEHELGINLSELTYSNKDEEFVKKAIQVVHDHMADPIFSVAVFIEKMGVSKTLLHTKLKEIVGKTASEFILSIRMKEASRLLKSQQYTITEVSDLVGFNDASYFSKSFKKYFNHSPREHHS